MWDPWITLLQVIAGSSAALGIVWGGATMMTAGANEELQEKGKSRVVKSIGGFLIVLLGPSIYTLIFVTLGEQL
jgi:hypothetical protein